MLYKYYLDWNLMKSFNQPHTWLCITIWLIASLNGHWHFVLCCVFQSPGTNSSSTASEVCLTATHSDKVLGHMYRYRNHHVHLSVCPTFENVDIKSMCEFHVIKCILFDFGITSMVKKIHTTFAWKLISCGNFGKKICCKIHLGHNQLYLTGHVGYSPFRIVSSWLYCRTSITRILMFSLLTTITLKKDFFQLYPKKCTFF